MLKCTQRCPLPTPWGFELENLVQRHIPTALTGSGAAAL